MKLETVEDVLEWLNVPGEGITNVSHESIMIGEIGIALLALANEIKELKQQLATNKLLIEHEEKVRTTKAQTISGRKTVVRFKKGDRVYRTKDQDKMIGTIVRVNASRIRVKFSDRECWVDARSLSPITKAA